MRVFSVPERALDRVVHPFVPSWCVSSVVFVPHEEKNPDLQPSESPQCPVSEIPAYFFSTYLIARRYFGFIASSILIVFFFSSLLTHIEQSV